MAYIKNLILDVCFMYKEGYSVEGICQELDIDIYEVEDILDMYYAGVIG